MRPSNIIREKTNKRKQNKMLCNGFVIKRDIKKWLRLVITVILFSTLFIRLAFASEQKISFAVISDSLRYYQGLEKALYFIDLQKVDFILVAGDFYPVEEGYKNYFTNHGYTIGPEHQPNHQEIYYALGNHDDPPDGEIFFKKNISIYYPKNGPKAAPEGTIFSFDRANCHFTITNQYWNYPDGGYTQDQLDWIERDLENSNQPFKFVIGHEPAYPQHRHIGDSLDSDPSMRNTFWEIMVQGPVQAYFCGHTHYSSIFLMDGVYQIDAGEARNDHECVIIVEVNSSSATVHYYESAGEIPTAKDEIDTIVLKPNSENEGSGGCFIAAAAYGSEIGKKIEILLNLRNRNLLINPMEKILVRAYDSCYP